MHCLLIGLFIQLFTHKKIVSKETKVPSSFVFSVESSPDFHSLFLIKIHLAYCYQGYYLNVITFFFKGISLSSASLNCGATCMEDPNCYNNFLIPFSRNIKFLIYTFIAECRWFLKKQQPLLHLNFTMAEYRTICSKLIL